MTDRARPRSPRRWRQRWRHSLRARLVTVFLLLALAMALVFIGGLRATFSSGWREAGQPLIADYIDRLAAEIGSPPSIERARALTERLPIAVRIDGPGLQWDSNPQRTAQQRRRGEHDAFGSSEFLTRTTPDGYRIRFALDSPQWQNGPRGAGWIALALLLAVVLAAYAYVRRLLRPLDDIRAGAERFGHADFGAPIPLRRRDELGDLAQRINTMAHEIEAMLDAKRALLLALSHELRSPLTRARLNAELLPDTPEVQPERAALLRDLAEMRDLIADLLESERLASAHAALQREPVDVPALVREVTREVQDEAARALAARAADAGPGNGAIGAPPPPIELDLPAALPPLALDRTRVRLLLRNLLANALRHGAQAGQPPRVTLRAEGAGVRLTVRDFGPGVDPAQLPHLTEPFYRADSARTRASGGVGLGLYLCALVARAHGGSLDLRNAQPGLEATTLLN